MSRGQQLVDAGARLTQLGLARGSAGNLSIRDGERILMSPTGSELGALDADALAVVDLDGAHLDGPRPSKEVPFHVAMYRRLPETAAVVHLHSPAASAASCLPAWSERSAIPPITPYFVMRVGQTPLIPYAAPGDAEQGRLMGRLPFPFRAALLQNHGSVVAGTTLDAAVESAIELEEACRIVLLVGDRTPRLLTDEEALLLAERYDSPWS